MTEHSAEYEQVRQAVQPVVDVAEQWAQFADDWHMWAGENESEWLAERVAVERVAMLTVVDARIAEHCCVGEKLPPACCRRYAELAALRKEIKEDA